jgi:hypothetical protein
MHRSLRAIIPAASLFALAFAAPALAQGSFEQNLAKAQKTLGDIDSLTTRIVERNGGAANGASVRSSARATTPRRQQANQNRGRRGNRNRANRNRRANPNTNPNRKNP